MISQPMKGKTKKEIGTQRSKIAMKVNKMLTEDINIMDTTIKNREEKTDLESFKESVDFLNECDLLVMSEDYESATDCKLEHEIAKAYAIPIIYEKDLKGD